MKLLFIPISLPLGLLTILYLKAALPVLRYVLLSMLYGVTLPERFIRAAVERAEGEKYVKEYMRRLEEEREKPTPRRG